MKEEIIKALSSFETAYCHIKIAVNYYVSDVYGDDSEKEGERQLENMKSWIKIELERTYSRAYQVCQSKRQKDIEKIEGMKKTLEHIDEGSFLWNTRNAYNQAISDVLNILKES